MVDNKRLRFRYNDDKAHMEGCHCSVIVAPLLNTGSCQYSHNSAVNAATIMSPTQSTQGGKDTARGNFSC